MKFKFFKSKKSEQNAKNSFLEASDNNLPEIYRGMQVYESESDRFCAFDEDYFIGENYDIKPNKKRKIISPPPKTPPLFFLGIFCGAMTILVIAGGITFLSLFSKFGGIYRSVTVPNLTNLSEQEAIDLIKNNYDCFDYSIEYKDNPNANSGTVISQIPKSSTMRKLYGINGRICIKLTVSRETQKITLPNLCGQNARDASLELKNAGINVVISETYSDTVKLGKIRSSSHSAGSKLCKNDTVYLTVSLGKKINYVTMPELVGKSESEAISILRRENLDISKVIYKSSSLPLGTVLEQSVSSGASVREGAKITLYVSGGATVEQ